MVEEREEAVRRAMRAGKPSEAPKPRNGQQGGSKAGPRGG